MRRLDVTDTAAVRRVVDTAFAELGRIDVVISNAGIGIFGAAEEMSDEQIEQQINTNVVGAVQLARAVTPHFREQVDDVRRRSQVWAGVASPGLSIYHLSKWGIEGFFKAYAAEVAPFGIYTTLVEPGMAATSSTAAGCPCRRSIWPPMRGRR